MGRAVGAAAQDGTSAAVMTMAELQAEERLLTSTFIETCMHARAYNHHRPLLPKPMPPLWNTVGLRVGVSERLQTLQARLHTHAT